jgi:PadR family transcriptional regulator
MSGLKPIELVALAGLADGPLHGYGLVVRIRGLTEGRVRVRPGNLYRVLHRLETAGLIEAMAESGAGEDERRRYFRLTPGGRRAVVGELGMYTSILNGSKALREARGG